MGPHTPPMLAGPPAVIWADDYLRYQHSDTHPMHPVRLELTMLLANSLGVLDGVELLTPGAATVDQLVRIHTPGYVRAVQSAPGNALPPGHGLGTEDNPIFADMHAASALYAGGTLAAAREVASGRALRAVTLGGGMHHAQSDYASGFCIYNDCAIAISWLLDNGFDRIAYVDVDVHHGDGVQAAFAHDPRVLTVSLHQHPATLWPSTGWIAEVGDGAAAGSIANIPLLPGTEDAEWLRAFHAVVPSLLGAFRPQILITQCGVDTHREDPLADLNLTVDGHRAIFRALRGLADRYADGKWIAVGGGGYGLVRVVPRSWTHLLAAVLDRDIDPDTAIPQSWLDHVETLTAEVNPPRSMSEGASAAFNAWDGGGVASDPRTARVDAVIRDSRRALLPLWGLDPEDPRD